LKTIIMNMFRYAAYILLFSGLWFGGQRLNAWYVGNAMQQLVNTLATAEALRPTPASTSIPLPTAEPTSAGPRTLHWFILYGGDYRAGDPIRNETGQQTDAVVLVSISEPPVTINTYSLARELLDADRNLKINQHMSHCGYPCIYAYYRDTWGVELEGVVLVNMSNFVYFVDGLGGVKITATVDTRDECGGKWYTFKTGETYRMNGEQLLCYARMRKHSPGGYFHRQLRWHDILVGLFNQIALKLREKPIAFIASTVDQLRVLFWTDMSLEQEVQWAVFGMNNLVNNEYTYTYCHWSLAQDSLELLPRPAGTEPYRYKSLVELDKWLQENSCE
jgi:LCP family protein required for cell wall assembly